METNVSILIQFKPAIFVMASFKSFLNKFRDMQLVCLNYFKCLYEAVFSTN